MLGPGTVLQNRYEIRGPLGQGGMGMVYVAADNRLGHLQVAVKEMDATQLAPADRQQTIDAFRHEAQILARLNHPGIARVMDYFSQGDHSYLVMEYVPGETLEEALARAPHGFDEKQAQAWIGQLAVVLDFLHRQNPPVIFRDLKPGNVMVQSDGTLKLIDFGIARLFKPGQTQDTVLLGTPGYAAPEQYGRGQSDPRSDVYTLAVVAHQLLTGYDPTLTPMRLPLLRQLRPDLSARVEAAVAQALQFDPRARFASTLAFAAALGAPTSEPLVAPVLATVTAAPPVTATVRAPAGGEPESRGGPPGWLWGFVAALALVAVLLLGWALLDGRLGGGGEPTEVAALTEAATLVTQIVTPTPENTSTPGSDDMTATAASQATLAALATEVAATAAAIDARQTQEAAGNAATATSAAATESAAQMAIIMTRAYFDAQTATAAAATPTVASGQLVEGFEYVSNQALATAYWTNPTANVIAMGLSSANVASGAYALEMQYAMPIGGADYVGLEKNLGTPMSWLNYSSLCLWLVNDNFNGHLVIQFRERNGETWKTEVPVANRTAGDVCIPLDDSQFFIAEFSSVYNGRLDLEAIENIAFYLGAGGADEGVFYLDNVRLVP